jgi:long-chain fatty acid transport protein
MKVRYIALLMLLFVAVGSVLPNGLSLNSIGPKGFGMGGAFVGLANDYSAIYWNPAGLTQMQKNFVGVFATDVIPMGTYKLALANIDTKTEMNHYIAPNLMGYYHCTLAEDLVWGLGVYVPAGIGTEWNGEDLKALSGNPTVEWMSKIGVINISPAAAYKFSDKFSIGVAFNIFYGMFDLKRPGGGGYQYKESSTGMGYGVTVGALVKADEMFSFGASFRTKTTVKMSGEAENPAMALYTAPAKSDFDREVSWPMWVAGGIAVHPMPEFVITADVQFSQWSESEDEFTTEFKDAKWVAATTPGDNNKFILRWKDVTQIRFGLGYSVDESLDLRAGFYIDPAPAPDETYNILFPSISYNAITIGGGYKISDFVFDLGVEYLMGKDREIDPIANPKAMSGTHGMNIFAFSFGIGYEFE